MSSDCSGWHTRYQKQHPQAYTQERAAMSPLVARAEPGELWIADRNFCMRTIRQGWQNGQAHFLVREHAAHPRVVEAGSWVACGRTETGEPA